MENAENNMFTVIDENGKEIEMEILLTFRNDEYNKDYVVYFDPKDEEELVDLMVSSYDDNGNLFPIEDDKEYDIIEEVVNTFLAEDENE